MTDEATTINGILAKLTINERAILWAYIDDAKRDTRIITISEATKQLEKLL